MRRLAVAGAALATVLGLAGCNQSGGDNASGSAATTTAAATPKDELSAAAKKLQEQPVKMKMEMGSTMSATGVADQKNRKADMTMTMSAAGQSMDMKMRLIGADLYMQFGGSLGAALGGSADKWMHIDASKIPAGSQLDVNNVVSADNYLAGLTKVEKTGAGAFKGELDMTKAPNADAESLAALGDKAKAVPFSAKVDDQGRMTELVIDMSGMGLPAEAGSKISTQYFDFGTPVAVEAPAKAQVQEMPANMLKAFTG